MFDFSKKIKVDDQEVNLNNKYMEFNEQTLTSFIQKMHGYYSYYGAKLAEAERELADVEREMDTLYNIEYISAKETGTDKLAESKAKTTPEYLELKTKAIKLKENVRLLVQYLKAWDKAHENAQSLGHFMRKEMDKIGAEIKLSDDYINELKRRI